MGLEQQLADFKSEFLRTAPAGQFDDVESRPGTGRTHAKGEPSSTQPAVTEDGKKLQFGQTAASVAGTWWSYMERITP